MCRDRENGCEKGLFPAATLFHRSRAAYFPYLRAWCRLFEEEKLPFLTHNIFQNRSSQTICYVRVCKLLPKIQLTETTCSLALVSHPMAIRTLNVTTKQKDLWLVVGTTAAFTNIPESATFTWNPKAHLPTMNWAVFVLSRQSTQFVLSTPFLERKIIIVMIKGKFINREINWRLSW